MVGNRLATGALLRCTARGADPAHLRRGLSRLAGHAIRAIMPATIPIAEVLRVAEPTGKA